MSASNTKLPTCREWAEAGFTVPPQLCGEDEVWDVQFAYQGKTQKHWRSVMNVLGSQRDAERLAVAEYVKDTETAVDFMVFPVRL